MKYLLLPFVSWCIAGGCKFLVNYLRFGKEAKRLIGYGGFPSTHTTVLSSVVVTLGLEHGFQTPECSFALGVLVLLMIDAHGLRRKVGAQAERINQLARQCGLEEMPPLRERMGHSWGEIFGGLILGSGIGWAVSLM